jgi:glycerol-3-phosphate cytidylyltransferase-like family protein
MKVVFSASIMDLCHSGHLNLLRKMRESADGGKTIMVIHDDLSCFKIKDKFPIQDAEHRKRNILLTGLIDEVVITKDVEPVKEFLDIIEKHRNQDLLFMRADDNIKFPAHAIIEKACVPIKFIEYTKGVSSTSLRDLLLQL